MGLIARVLEEAGIATVCITMRREVAQNVKPPRALAVGVKFPFGAPLGPAGDAETQRGVTRSVEALSVLSSATELGTIVDSPRAWKR